MKTAGQQSVSAKLELTVARKLHPEDISVGDFVALLEISFQFPSFLWCGADHALLPPERRVRITFLPIEDHEAMKVKAVCLPFILCKMANGKHRVYDVRQVQLAKLDVGFARKVRDKSGKKGRKTKDNKKRK